MRPADAATAVALRTQREPGPRVHHRLHHRHRRQGDVSDSAVSLVFWSTPTFHPTRHRQPPTVVWHARRDVSIDLGERRVDVTVSRPESRSDAIARYRAEFADQIKHVAGATVISAAVTTELVAFVALLESEVAGRSRQISARLEALRQLLQERRRVHATNGAMEAVAAIPLQHEVDVFTAAKMIHMKPDTLRKCLREGRIEGRRTSRGWMVPLSAIDPRRVA
jgi:hypothetical protein